MGLLHDGEPTSVSAVASSRLAAFLLAGATVTLFIALFLPWWSLKVITVLRTHVVVSTGFSSWGWLSFAAGLVTLVVTVRLLVVPKMAMHISPERHLDSQVMAWVTLIAGVAELLGNVLFIIAAPKTQLGFGGSNIASHGIGIVIAMVCGLTLIMCGLLMLIRKEGGSHSLRHKLRLLSVAAPGPQRLQMPCPD